MLNKFARIAEMISEKIKNALLEPKVRKSLSVRVPEAIGARFVLYFADDPLNSYQVRQWYEPMRRLAAEYPVTVLVRRPTTARDLATDSPLPVALVTNMSETEEFLLKHPVSVVFYVNNNKENFLMLRFREQTHVHLSHGESDKTSMTSNQLKAYDKAFIAGAASRERIMRQLRNFDATHLEEIGRPQLDAPKDRRRLPDDGRTVVLYAPTWEGDRPEMAYGSVLSHGETMVSSLLADPSIRLIYRPHPRVGVRQRKHTTVSAAIKASIEAANLADPSAKHTVDDAVDFGWPLEAADVCICDISAVATDWLATRKPLIVTRPLNPLAKVDAEGLAGELELLEAAEAMMVNDVVLRLAKDGTPPNQLALLRHHFGDTTPGASMQRFLQASRSLL